MTDPLVETWNIHDRINRYLLAAVAEDACSGASLPKMRTAFQLFAHIHNVRLMWLKAAAPELLAGLAKIEGTIGDKKELDAALKASGAGDRGTRREGGRGRGQGEELQAACDGVRRLSHLARIASSRADRLDAEGNGASARQEDGVRIVGVGRAVT